MNNKAQYFQVVIPGFALESLTYKTTEPCSIGSCVIIKLRGYKKIGYIITKLSIEQIKKISFKTLSIEKVLEEKYNLTDSQLYLSKWMVKFYINPVGLNYELFSPRGLKIKNDKIDYSPVKKKFIKVTEQSINEDNKYYSDYLKLQKVGTIKLTDILSIDISKSRINTLIKNGVAETYISEEARKISMPSKNYNSSIHPLNNEQENAYNSIKKCYNKYSPFLLHGITGSGKTNVYQHIATDIVQQGKSVLILVPEIGLTPQLFSKFYTIFGNKTVYYNSQLNTGEKHEIWLGVKTGQYQVIVGTRSAMFLPFKNLKAIFIDEEHDESFIQSNSPFYNANDVASIICKNLNIPLILGTATPSLSTYYRAKKGKITILKLIKRATNVTPPSLRFIDLQKEKMLSPLMSEYLLSEIRKTIQNKKKVILYFNRRGYNTMSICDSCKEVAECPHCSTSLVYHYNEKNYRCHICGFSTNQLNRCECGGNFEHNGIGNQQIEENLEKLFPNTSIIRMDRDSVSGKGGHEKVLNKFISANKAILIGTQMITKGHNIENVGLVGVLIADMGLSYPDYRNEEKVFQQLLQVIGRTGREKEQGKAIIQTYNINNPIFRYIKTANFEAFAQYQFDLREKYKYPPFYNISRITLISKKEKILQKRAKTLFDLIKITTPEIEAIGPFQPLLYKKKDEFYLGILLKHYSILELNKGIKTIKSIFNPNDVKVYYKLNAENDTV